jgi:hypothetical protein
MPRKWKSSLSLCLALLFVLAAGAEAQTAETSQTQLPASVTASIAVERARFTAPAGVAELRLEVFTAAGEKVFDSDFKPGNLLDWPFQDQQEQRLADGSYRCVITTKDLSGRLAQKRGEVRVHAGAATFEEAGDQTTQESGSSNAVSREAFLAILREGLTRATAVLAHDGEKGRLVSGSGGLSFRVGDFFAGKDVERMRLTPEGNLGIGLSNPQARLDVAGMIRTSEGIMFPDGTIQTTAANASGRSGSDLDNRKATGGSENAAPSALNISGAGTTNRVTKWINGPGGIVGDSAITEVGGRVGIGIANPSAKLQVESNDTATTVHGVSSSLNGNGVIGEANNGANANGLFGRSSAGAAVRGVSTSGIGVIGQSGSGNAVFGVTSGSKSVAGVYGWSLNEFGNGVIGEANGEKAFGIWGKNTNGTGVRGESASGWGVHGISKSYIGVEGTSSSSIGVNGNSSSGPGVGGYSSTGRGVWGSSSASNGVFAYGTGKARFNAALRADNGNADQGMAAYMTNSSQFATAHFANAGNGEALYLQANGGPFIRAVNHNESKTVFSVNYDGTTVTNVLQITGGADFAEHFEVNEAPEAGSSPQIQPGLVVAIDPNNPGKLVVSSHAYDRRVAGVISGAGGVKPGMMMSQADSIADGAHPVALSGRVYCWADASNGPIEPGDLLTTSNVPGQAMKVTDHAKAQGAIIGKAMTSLKQGRGLVLVLVTLQ